LKSNGTVVGWGYDYAGQATIPDGLRNVVAIAAGGGHSLALKSNGTVVGWGAYENGQIDIPVVVGGPTQTRTPNPNRTDTITRTSTDTRTPTNTRTSINTRTPTALPMRRVLIDAGSTHGLALQSKFLPR